VGERLVDRIQVKHGDKHVHNHDDFADILNRCLENPVDCVELTVELGAAAPFHRRARCGCAISLWASRVWASPMFATPRCGGHSRDGVSRLMPTTDRPDLASTRPARRSMQRCRRQGPCSAPQLARSPTRLLLRGAGLQRRFIRCPATARSGTGGRKTRFVISQFRDHTCDHVDPATTVTATAQLVVDLPLSLSLCVCVCVCVCMWCALPGEKPRSTKALTLWR
jgi:hypothetical protein